MTNNTKKKIAYGGITNICTYIIDQYGEKGVLVKRGRPIVINSQSMAQISGRVTRNCSVVAVTRIIDYYRKVRKLPLVPEDIKDTYKYVEEVAESYGYTDKRGTMPFFISSIARECFKNYGVKARCKGNYVFSFDKHVVKEIDAGRPVIMNIARGYYKDHTVVVCGYSIWLVGDKKKPFLKVIDGWKSGYHYIDYEAFSKDISQSIFGSFNTIRL